MNYLSEMLKLPVLDVDGEKLGVVNDFGIATGEVFPHVTSLAFRGPGKTPFMISWRKWVDRIDETGVHLKSPATEIRFSYLQPTELLLARDVLNKQIVDTQGMKVVRVNDIKFSMSGENQLRLLGAEVGARGLLRAISPALEHVVEGFMKHLGKPLGEDIIAWSYMDLLDRSTKNIQLSVSHKTLGELHPADIADIIEQLDPRLRAQVFAQLDTAQAAEAISEFDDDELMTEMLEGLSDTDASSMLAMMDPDDAADLIDELDYEKAEKLLRLMGVQEEKAIRNLLGYEDNTAGRIMTSEFVSLPATATVGDAIEAIRQLDEDFESVYYVYTEDPSGMLTGVLSLRTLIVADEGAYVSYLEGCTAPQRDENQLHAAVVEIVVERDAEVKYSTVQNWYPGDKEGKGGVYNFVTKRGICRENARLSWTQVETGSAITWKYPSCILAGDNSVGEFYSVAMTNHFQQADTGTKMIHVGRNTRSRIVSKGISAGRSENSYRGLVRVAKAAENARNYSQCDSLLIGDKCGAHTFPVIESGNPTAVVEHEATTSKISEEQLFYCNQRGLTTEDAVGLIVNGYAREVLNKLPMEFAVEAQKLLAISLEGSVG